MTLLTLPKRLLRLGLSLWMICDMVFDVMQIRTYWTHAHAQREQGYFISAAAAWFLPPLIYLMFGWFYIEGKGIIFTMLMQKNFGPGWPKSRCNQFLYVLGIPAFLLIDLAKATLMVYVYIPTMDIILAFSELIYGVDNAESQAMPGLKLFEQFGEAVPQIAIALAFYINVSNENDERMKDDELHIEVELQGLKFELKTTLHSILLSFGSILIGVAMGIKRWPIMRAMVERNKTKFNAKAMPRKELERQFLALGGLSQDIVGSTTNKEP